MSQHPLDLDALLLGGVDVSRREELLRHVQDCRACADELELLTDEQRLFSQRRAMRARVTADFSRVAAGMRREERRRTPRMGAVGAVLAAAVVMLQVGHTPVPSTPECDAGGMCGASWLAISWCESDDKIGDDVARAEDEFSACLIATPG